MPRSRDCSAGLGLDHDAESQGWEGGERDAGGYRAGRAVAEQVDRAESEPSGKGPRASPAKH